MEVLDLTPYDEPRTALIELHYGLASAHARGVKLLKILHSAEGRRKIEIRRFLRRYKSEGKLRCIVYGEDLSAADGVFVRYLTDKYPAMADEEPSGTVTYADFG